MLIGALIIVAILAVTKKPLTAEELAEDNK